MCFSLLDGTGLEKINIESEQHNKVHKINFGTKKSFILLLCWYVLCFIFQYMFSFNEEREHNPVFYSLALTFNDFHQLILYISLFLAAGCVMSLCFLL